MVIMRSWHEYMTIYHERIEVLYGNQDTLNRTAKLRKQYSHIDTVLVKEIRKKISLSLGFVKQLRAYRRKISLDINNNSLLSD